MQKDEDKEDGEVEMSYEEALVYSARVGDQEEVEGILGDPPVNINFKDKSMCENTALHVAAANGHAKIVQMLLAQLGEKGHCGIINPNV